jgi:alpha-methylacyl-CoA racemase
MKPLQGVRIVELAAIGPVPWCGMILAGMGASVIRVDRPGGAGRNRRFDVTGRGRGGSIQADLKTPEGVATVLGLLEKADAVMEGMRPGVVERLGLGPDVCLAANPRLVFGRMTGWGQDGPLAPRAGHDINYIAISGALHAIGPRNGPPVPPLNLVGDYGGGGAFLAMGLLAGILHARATGHGQVVDAAMIDGTVNLMAMQYGRHSAGEWHDARGANIIDGGAPWYDVYEAADGLYLAVGAIEPAFYERLLAGLGLDPDTLPAQHDRSGWPDLRRRFAEVFRTRSRDEWAAHFEGVDACVSPVLSLAEAPHHPHNAQRASFVSPDGVVQPAPAPRFSLDRAGGLGAEPRPVVEVLQDWGFSASEADRLAGNPAVGAGQGAV